MNINRMPSDNPEQATDAFSILQERLRGHNGSLRIAKENPGPGELTVRELRSFDPVTDESDFASAAIVLGVVHDGEYSPEKFLAELAGGEDNEDLSPDELTAQMTRVEETFKRMLGARLLQERDGKIHLNVSVGNIRK